jgi:succinate dehydrogenase/fumarate reductase-like Fe-S protein
MSTSTEKAQNMDNKDQPKQNLIPIFVMGKKYMVPDDLTIMKAMEYVGYQFVRGCGCRMGVCGACGTVYRKPDDYRIRVALACQSMVEPNMYLTQIPFFPANRATYNLNEMEGKAEEVFQAYPELFRCVACNACTKVCPVEVKVLDYISAIKRGDLEAACEISFDCIQCGLCTSRCMGELPQYHIAQMVRRLVGAKLMPSAQHNKEQRQAIAEGRYKEIMDELVSLGKEELTKLYQERQWESAKAGEDWRPESNKGLL